MSKTYDKDDIEYEYCALVVVTANWAAFAVGLFIECFMLRDGKPRTWWLSIMIVN